MVELEIRLADGRARYAPGEAIRGTAEWRAAGDVDELEIRLIWFTEGRGDRDVAILDEVKIDTPSPSGERDFEFAAPDSPLSFSGQLITLQWAVELVALPSREAKLAPFVLSHGDREIDIQAEPPEEA